MSWKSLKTTADDDYVVKAISRAAVIIASKLCGLLDPEFSAIPQSEDGDGNGGDRGFG